MQGLVLVDTFCRLRFNTTTTTTHQFLKRRGGGKVVAVTGEGALQSEKHTFSTTVSTVVAELPLVNFHVVLDKILIFVSPGIFVQCSLCFCNIVRSSVCAFS